MPTKEQILEALKGVKFPGLSRDIVSFGFVHDVIVDGGNVAFTVRFQTENQNAKEQITSDAEAAVRGVEGVESVRMVVDVGSRQAAGPQGGAPAEILSGVKYKIAVASGKGGVGKSTVSTNLALALHALGYTVGMLDADIYGPSQQMMLGIEGRPQIDETDEKIIPMENHGIKTMSLGLITDPDTPVIWRGPMVMKALDQFLTDVKWGVLDFLIIDLPPGTGDAQLTLTQKVPLSGAVVVTTPQDVALIDARKGLAMFRKVNVPVLGIIENMSYFICRHCGEREEIFGHGGGRKTAELLGVPFLGEIPIDPKVVVGGDTGAPIVVLDPSSAAAEAFRTLAATVAKQVESGAPGHTHETSHAHAH
ncbi:MAG: ATP-binding protein involved in chromosome partitioning [Thermoanaerobaculia bacterium]|jgi:ATP-binding protein involved in chromosome partitioning|nr:ATP-binding protein involved in chromosome partitioning [Thermoanaerobaculia bacterium]